MGISSPTRVAMDQIVLTTVGNIYMPNLHLTHLLTGFKYQPYNTTKKLEGWVSG